MYNFPNNIKILLVIVLFHCTHLSAADVSKALLDLLPYAKVVIDKSSDMSPEEVMSKINHNNYISGEDAKSRHAGSHGNTIWVLVDISNTNPYSMERWVGVHRPELSRSDAYELTEFGIQKISFDEMRFDRERHSYKKPRTPLYRIQIESNSSRTFLFALHSFFPYNLTFESMSNGEYMSQRLEIFSINFVYYGIIISLVIYSLFFYASQRETSFLLYALFGFTMGAATSLYSGFTTHLFGISSGSKVHYLLVQALMISATMLSVGYTMTTFKLKEVHEKLYFFAKITIALGSFVLMGVTFLDLVTLSNAVSILQAIGIAFVIASSGTVYFKLRNSTALLFLIGWNSFVFSFVIWLLGRSGYFEQTYLVSFAPLFGNIIEMLCTAIALSLHFHSITKENYEARLTKKEKESLQTLVHVVCHDIASPLGVILGSCELAGKERADDIIKGKCWERVERASKSINLIIKKVKKLQAVKTGKAKILLEKVNIESVFEEVKFNVIDRSIEKEVQLDFRLEKRHGEDLIVIADETSLIYDVVINLVSNAIKFSPRNSEIVVSARPCSENNRIEIQVTDHGVGIPEDLLPMIFLESGQTSRRGTENEAGTGFGMPLTKFFIDQYGGEIKVESQEKNDQSYHNHGTTVTIVLDAA